jgi:hypothetical protein
MMVISNDKMAQGIRYFELEINLLTEQSFLTITLTKILAMINVLYSILISILPKNLEMT